MNVHAGVFTIRFAGKRAGPDPRPAGGDGGSETEQEPRSGAGEVGPTEGHLHHS